MTHVPHSRGYAPHGARHAGGDTVGLPYDSAVGSSEGYAQGLGCCGSQVFLSLLDAGGVYRGRPLLLLLQGRQLGSRFGLRGQHGLHTVRYGQGMYQAHLLAVESLPAHRTPKKFTRAYTLSKSLYMSGSNWLISGVAMGWLSGISTGRLRGARKACDVFTTNCQREKTGSYFVKPS